MKRGENRLREILDDRDMTIADFAAACGMVYPHAWRVVSGGQKPHPATRKRVSEALRLPAEEIWPESASGRG